MHRVPLPEVFWVAGIITNSQSRSTREASGKHTLLPSGGTAKGSKSAIFVPPHGTVVDLAVPYNGTVLYCVAVLPVPFDGTVFVIFFDIGSGFNFPYAPG